jgi:cytidine deaminase
MMMNAGNRLRQYAGDWSALGALGVMRAAAARAARRDDKNERSPAPVAYVFDSLKNPREADLLRSVYGSALWIVALVEDISERKDHLVHELADAANSFTEVPEATAVALIARDAAEDEEHGQHVRDVFAMADYFLPIRRGIEWAKELDRFLLGAFGAPFIAPTAEEEAMRHAQAAALRSAAVGRQVGAVIVPKTGSPYILGTNEVPKPGGGQYREGDSPDHRDFRSGADANPAYVERAIRELFEKLAQAKYFTSKRNKAGGDAIFREASTRNKQGKSVLDGTRAKALIEFTRCLHAEQSAIVDAARTGVAIAGARLFTTTFPCHECTKFIVGAGIVEVQYIEPYPKSLAGEMYRDLINALPPMAAPPESAELLSRVPFRPFLGFGPSRYDEVFKGVKRKSGSGLRKQDPATACPVGHGWQEIAVREKEDEVTVAIVDVVDSIPRIERPVEAMDLGTEGGPRADDSGDDGTAVGSLA